MAKPKGKASEGPSGFGARLVQLRTSKGLTRQVLAAEIGVTVPTIRVWENGDYSPGYWNLVELAKFFGISPNWLTGMNDLRSAPK